MYVSIVDGKGHHSPLIEIPHVPGEKYLSQHQRETKTSVLPPTSREVPTALGHPNWGTRKASATRSRRSNSHHSKAGHPET